MRYSHRILLIVLAVGPPILVFVCASYADPDAAAFGAFVSLLFAAVASLARFFSSRPRLFIQVFAPKEEYRNLIRSCLRDPNFGQSMRMISNLQFIVALWVGAAMAWFGQ